MKKKLLSLLSCIVILLIFMPTVAYADLGPKPSVVIDFKGLNGESYYVTLLSNVASTGPFSSATENYATQRYTDKDEDYKIWRKFVDYKDKDGYYFLQYFQDCTQTSQFKWGYRPPSKFKILIYFPQKDSFLVSDKVFERYAFDSYFTATINDSVLQAAKSDGFKIAVEQSYDYKDEIISLFARIIATIVIEILIALLFGLRKKNLLHFIIVVNVITQSILNILLNVINYNQGSMMFVFDYVWMELLVFTIEAVAYSIYFNKVNSQYNIKKWVAPIYSLCANAVSFGIGLYIAYIVPGIF